MSDETPPENPASKSEADVAPDPPAPTPPSEAETQPAPEVVEKEEEPAKAKEPEVEPHFPPPTGPTYNKKPAVAEPPKTADTIAKETAAGATKDTPAVADTAKVATDAPKKETPKDEDAPKTTDVDPPAVVPAIAKAIEKLDEDGTKKEEEAAAVAAVEAKPKTKKELKAEEKARKKALEPKGNPLIKGRLADLFAIVSGLLYFAAFAGFDIWPLTFVCLVPLYLSLIGQTTKRATWLAFLTGLAMNLGGFYWLINMLKTFSGFPLPLCLLFTVIICAYQGGRLALMGWLHGRATNRGWPVPAVFAVTFAVSELVYPLLFPWYYAATVHKVPLLMQLSDIGGPILVGLVLISVNLAIAEPIRAKLAAKRELAQRTVAGEVNEERFSTAINRRIIGIGVIAIVIAGLYGAVRISMTKSRMEHAEQVKVGYVQGNMSLMGKRENPGEGLRRHKQMTSELRAKGVDLVVWSETSATFPTREDLATKGNFFRDRFASSLQVPTIFGAVLYRVDEDRERWFNTAIGTDIKGDIKGRYDKQYLLAFGEYLPFGETFPILHKWSPHSGRFSPGTSLEPIVMPIKGADHPISVLICYEDILPGFTNRAVKHANPELLVNMTNDAWFGDTLEPWQHLALAKFRAVEHRRYLIRSTNSGVSAIIDPNGNIVDGSLSSTFHAEAHDGVVRWLRGTTGYEIIGDWPYYLLTLAAFVAAFRRRRTSSGGAQPAPATAA